MTAIYNQEAQTISDGVPDDMTAFEHHLNQLAIRAVRLQDEHAARVDEQQEERRRPSGMVRSSGRIVSPFQAMVDRARASRDDGGDKQGFIARLFNW